MKTRNPQPLAPRANRLLGLVRGLPKTPAVLLIEMIARAPASRDPADVARNLALIASAARLLQQEMHAGLWPQSGAAGKVRRQP
jgi:hypothetical protein